MSRDSTLRETMSAAEDKGKKEGKLVVDRLSSYASHVTVADKKAQKRSALDQVFFLVSVDHAAVRQLRVGNAASQAVVEAAMSCTKFSAETGHQCGWQRFHFDFTAYIGEHRLVCSHSAERDQVRNQVSTVVARCSILVPLT